MTAPILYKPRFNSAAFFDHVRQHLFGGTLTQSQVDGINTISFGGMLLDPVATHHFEQMSYIFATAYHETGQTMQPIEEWGKGAGYEYAPNWYGRGYVQLTWEENYRYQEQKMHEHHDMLGKYEIPYQVHNNPNYALVPSTAAIILIGGMRDGDFTGKALNDYIHSDGCDYVEARRIVNGTDRQHDIAYYAEQFETAIRLGAGETL